MLPPRCIQPPCMNIELSVVIQNGPAWVGARSVVCEYSAGTTDQVLMICHLSGR
jgi:hypothetical protein